MTGKDDPTINCTHLMVKLSLLAGRKIILFGRRGLMLFPLHIMREYKDIVWIVSAGVSGKFLFVLNYAVVGPVDVSNTGDKNLYYIVECPFINCFVDQTK